MLQPRPSRDPARRLAPFVARGLLDAVPTNWQLIQGQFEMAPYVVAPDDGDRARYAGAPLGHPLARTPLVFWRIGLDHLRIGHGLHASAQAVYTHLAIVFHEGLPTFDLQLAQTLPDGTAGLRRHLEAVRTGATAFHRRERAVARLVLPDPEAYWRCFTEAGGWIDQVDAFDYPSVDAIADFLRPEFMSLVGFASYCARTFHASPWDRPLASWPGELARLAGTYGRGRRAAG